MRIRNLFTVPTGEKVTEKALRRVLISSICSILLCMTCLAGSTWAWFAESVENKEIVIKIAKAERSVSVKLADDDSEVALSKEGNYDLKQGTKYKIAVAVQSDSSGEDAFGRKQSIFVSMTVSYQTERQPENYVFEFTENGTKEIYLQVNEAVKLSFGSVSWIKPEKADPVDTEPEPIVVGEVPEPPTSEPTTEATTESTAATTEPTTAMTEPAIATTESTTATTESTAATTESTTAATESTTAATTG